MVRIITQENEETTIQQNVGETVITLFFFDNLYKLINGILNFKESFLMMVPV